MFPHIPNRLEHQLLLCCARTEASPLIAEEIRSQASAPLDWDYFFLLARRHAVLSLVYKQLQKYAADLVPPTKLKKWRQEHLENAARNVLLAAELCRLINLLGEHDVEAIPYKGPSLSIYAYGDLSLRRFVDLDVMVRKQDVLKARALLLEQDYAPAKNLTVDQQKLLLGTQHNMQFTREGGKMIVELHWEVASHLFASSVSADELWQQLETIEMDGTRMKTLSSDDLLFSLCVHGSRHLWERLSWICDVAELIHRRNLNWDLLLSRAARADCERIFFLGLSLAQELLGTVLPDVVQTKLKFDRRIPILVQEVTERLFSGPIHTPASSAEIFRYNLDVRSSWRARARYFLFMLRPTDSDLSSASLPAGWNFAYYLVRPFRLLTKHN